MKLAETNRNNATTSGGGIVTLTVPPVLVPTIQQELIALVPAEPDLTIGEMIRSIIPQPPDRHQHAMDSNNNASSSTTPATEILSSCVPTSQIRILATNRTTSASNTERVWLIEALDENGKRKSVGGDEFYITFKHHRNRPEAVAFPTDNEDGTYRLEFVQPSFGDVASHDPVRPDSVGTLKVNFIYTCSIGRMTRPSKDDWATGGYLGGTGYTIENIKAPHVNAIREPTDIDLSKFDKVICFGDSILENMCGRVDLGNFMLFKQKNVEVEGNAGSIIRSDLIFDEMFPLLDKWHGEDLRRNDTSIALLLGSAAWEMFSNLGPLPGHYFNNSLQMYHDMIAGVRERYPGVTIFWKSPSAVHLTAIDERLCRDMLQCNDRVRYISNSIAKYLYDEQKRIMAALNVTFFDVWDTTYVGERWHMSKDAQHYRKWMNLRLLDYLYPESMQLNNYP